MSGIVNQISGKSGIIGEFGEQDNVTLTGTETLTNKTFVAPALGTPASGNATNLSGIPATDAADIGAGVLPTDVTGGAGLTALGTITAGNISAAAITRPSGAHLQRVVTHVYQSGHASLHSGQWVGHTKENSLKFNFTPKSTSSYFMLEHSYGIMHTSNSGGHGAYAFVKNTTRNGWQEGGYNDDYGHFMTGSSTTAGWYQTIHGTLRAPNASTTAFLLKLQLNWASSNWYYGHDGSFHHLSITEILN